MRRHSSGLGGAGKYVFVINDLRTDSTQQARKTYEEHKAAQRPLLTPASAQPTAQEDSP